MMNAFKQWWAEASSRDQLALIICAGFLFAYFLYVGVLKPVQDMREDEIAKNRALSGSLENVRNLAAQVIAQQQSGSRTVNESRSLENIVQQTVSANGLQVASMNASGKTGVRIRFEEAPFEKVLKWLYEICGFIKSKFVSATSQQN